MSQLDIREQMRGRWRDVLIACGISANFLKNKHGPCPLCGGKDRFRWDDRGGTGSYYCSQCGSGSGFDLVMKKLGINFKGACDEVRKHIPDAQVRAQKASNDNYTRQIADKLWSGGHPLRGYCPASMYLKSRLPGIRDWPVMLRYHPEARYYYEGKKFTTHPAMVARFVGADRKDATTHITYLTEDGQKADVPEVRKLCPGKIPEGGAVRLSSSAETMGVAEGIETALAASLLDEVPVWAALTANNLAKWQPPENAGSIIIYGDNDNSFTGQQFAYVLARRLKNEGKYVEVRLPDEPGSDWNDYYQMMEMA
jgi:putative DNA primase/helicase